VDNAILKRNQHFSETLSHNPSLHSEGTFMPTVTQAQEWTATLHSSKLKVHGTIKFPTTGYKVALKKQEPQGINPAILLLAKTVTDPTGVVADHITAVDVHFNEHTTVHYKEVQILPDGPTIKINHHHSA
jgi:hypothetical protein